MADVSTKPAARLSPRFESALLHGGNGNGLLLRALEETRRRAYEHWQLRPSSSAQENWAKAERSLVRSELLEAATGEVECGVMDIEEAADIMEEVPEKSWLSVKDEDEEKVKSADQNQCDEIDDVDETTSGGQSGDSEEDKEVTVEADHFGKQEETQQCMEDSDQGDIGLVQQLLEKLQLERQHSDGLAAALRTAEERADDLANQLEKERAQRAELAAAMRPAVISGQVPEDVGIARSRVPKLAIQPKGQNPRQKILSDRSTHLSSGRSSTVNWPGSGTQLPPLPMLPPEHHLLTPRTGATPRTPHTPSVMDTPRKCELQQVPERARRHSSSQSTVFQSPGSARSRSSSPSNSSACSDFDNFDRWSRLESLESNFEVEHIPLSCRTEKVPVSARSNSSLYGIYGTGPEAETHVLRKVIRDLELRLQEQAKDLQVMRAPQGSAASTEGEAW